MDRKTALKVLETIPWNGLRCLKTQPGFKRGYVALSEEQMGAVAIAMTTLRHLEKVEHTMLLEGQKVDIFNQRKEK